MGHTLVLIGTIASYIGSVFTATILIPQLIKVLRDKEAIKGFSLFTTIINNLSAMFWIPATIMTAVGTVQLGIAETILQANPMFIALLLVNSISLICGISLLVLKIKSLIKIKKERKGKK